MVHHIHQLGVEYASVPMLGRTHNQPASPTTVGKEFNVFSHRIQYLANVLKTEIHGKRTNTQLEIDVITESLSHVIENLLGDLRLYNRRGLLSYDYRKAEELEHAIEDEDLADWVDILVDLLNSVDIDQDRCAAELDNHYECLGEALQTILRQYQVPQAYEIVKKVTRGTKMNKDDYQTMLQNLFADPVVQGKLSDRAKTYLLELTPQTFIGEAPELAKL
jgi:adenylosuccinate lyase